MGAISRHVPTFLLALAFSVGRSRADITPSFVWGFNTFNGTSLPECARLQIFVGLTGSGINTPAKPPYTLIAYEAGGIPTAQMVGSELTNLWWTVDHAAGSQLVLSMADAAGNAGGVGEDLYSVTTGTTGTSCHATNPTSPVSITTNTTKTIKSCDILPLKISGGQKPYTITVAALGSSAATNFTLGSAFDTYNWVNRASPNSQILATVSDAAGVYAASTNLLTTSGTTDLTCGGLQSTEIDSTGQASAVQSGTAAVTAASSATSTSSTDSSSKSTSTSKSPSMGTIIGGVVGGIVLIGALIMGALFFLKKQRTNARGPRPYVSEDSYGEFGLGKVAGQNPAYSNVGSYTNSVPYTGAGSYSGITPRAEEITPFVSGNGQSTPYLDHVPYSAATFSSRASENTLGPHVQPQNAPYSAPQNVAPRTMSMQSSQSISTSFDPYSDYGAAASVVPTSPSAYTTQSAYDPPVVPPIPGPSQRAPSVGGSAIGSARTGEAGPSTSRARFAVMNVSGVEEQQTEKQGAVPPEPRRESIYQHEDISDVVELPPAYKERDLS